MTGLIWLGVYVSRYWTFKEIKLIEFPTFQSQLGPWFRHRVKGIESTGRPLSIVLPCPNKGSRWWFLNFPQLRDTSYSNIFNVHKPGKACTESFFNLNTAHLWPSIFCWKFVFICIVFELFNCGYGTPYTSVHCCVRVTFWLMLVREK